MKSARLILPAVANGIFALFPLLYPWSREAASRLDPVDLPLFALFHLVLIAQVLVLPGLALLPLVRRRPCVDSVHAGGLVLALSTGMVLLVKLVLNLVAVPITAWTFWGGLLAAVNLCLAIGLARGLRLPGTQSDDYLAACGKRWIVATLAVLLALFLVLELVGMQLMIVPDADRMNFGTASIMERSVPGSGFYEEADTDIYPDFTPYLLHDFSHPPLALFYSAYVATLGGYLEYSRIFSEEHLLATGKDFNYDYLDLEPAQDFLFVNRVSTNFFCLLLCALMVAFAFRLTGRAWIGLLVMAYLIVLFWNLPAFAFSLLDPFKPVFVFYSVLVAYGYLYLREERGFNFAVALLGSLANQKVLYVMLAIVLHGLITRRGWRKAVFNEQTLGYAAGIVLFVAYGLVMNHRVFISHYFVLHLYERLVSHPELKARALEGTGKDPLHQWATYIRIFGTGPFVAVCGLAAHGAVRLFRFEAFVLPLFALAAGVVGTCIWPHAFRYLIPATFPLLLTASVSVGFWADRWSQGRTGRA